MSGRACARVRCSLLAGLMLMPSEGLISQSLGDTQSGAVVPSVVSTADAAMTYAVYLPTAYDGERRLPIAFLMDPRGRAQLPLELMKSAAERYGWVLMSSYNTRSDSAGEINVRALNAMLTDAQNQLSVDANRIYLVGFSGTARLAWDFMAAMGDAVAGILGAGASGIQYAARLGRNPETHEAAFFGAVGVTDFNYEEMRSFEQWLAALGVPYRIRYFDGAHTWPPENTFSEAVAWFELQAMRRGRAARAHSHISAVIAADTAAAEQLERAGLKTEALARWQEIARDSADATLSMRAQTRASVLARDNDVRATLRRRAQLHREFIQFNATLAEWVRAVGESKRLAEPKRGAQTLQLERLQQRSRSPVAEEAAAAQRHLEHAFVILSFYETRRLLTQGRPAQALVLLEIADSIKPNSPRVALHRAYALVQLDRPAAALEQLEKAVRFGLQPAAFATDGALRPLADDERFLELVK